MARNYGRRVEGSLPIPQTRRPPVIQMPQPKPQRRRSGAGFCTALVVLAACGCWLLIAAGASAANFTWSGGGGTGAKTWSTGTNWVGNTAPTLGASLGTLTFPKLAARVQSENDLSGLSIEQLQLDNTRGL